MFRMLRTIREEREALTKLKGLCPDGMIPRGLLMEGSDAIKDALQQFEKAKEIDRRNEAMPSQEYGSAKPQ